MNIERDASNALDNLRVHQRQLDADGCEVGVSRQALDEVIRHCGKQAYRIAALEAQLAARTGAVKATGLVEFAKEMCRIGFDGGSIDGCDILDTAVEHGLCKVVQFSRDMKGIAHSEYFEEGDAVYVFTEALASHPRETNTVVSHEAENVRGKPAAPEAQQEPDPLRAAAPEMLAALKRMTKLAREVAQPVGSMHAFWDDIFGAEAVIAKAEGLGDG